MQKILRSLNKVASGREMKMNTKAVGVSRNDSSSSVSSLENKNDSENYEAMVAPKEEVIRYIADSLVKVGANREDALTIGEHLFTADYRGHFSHGMNRMEMYVNDVRNKMTDPKGKPEIIRDFQAVATVDGNNGFGQVIGNYCMNLAIDKAKKFGIGMVSCRGSNHYGIAGYYSMLAMRENLIGFSCTNTSPLMAPTRSKVAALGTNPISLGARGSNEDEFLLDMATTCVALGKIELAMRKGSPIPMGWALGTDGEPTENSEMASKFPCLMPLGGEEKNSGYKGYGLAFLVEILSGILSGSAFGPNVRHWSGSKEIANLGHCFIAIDPERFAPGWKTRLDRLLKQIRDLPTASDDKSVVIAGDPERNHMKTVDEQGGISYHVNQLRDSEKFANEIGVRAMRLVRKKYTSKL